MKYLLSLLLIMQILRKISFTTGQGVLLAFRQFRLFLHFNLNVRFRIRGTEMLILPQAVFLILIIGSLMDDFSLLVK